MPKSFTSPLTVYVLWHPNYSDGEAIAKRLFNVLSRNVDDPFSRTPGIPVYFRSAAALGETAAPLPIPFGEADHTAIVVLVDNEMVVSTEWQSYVENLADQASRLDGKARLFPVAVNTNAFSFPISNTNFIRLFEVPREELPQLGTSANGGGAAPPPTSASGGITINLFINADQPLSVRAEQVPTEIDRLEATVNAANAEPGRETPESDGDHRAVAAAERFLDRQVRFLTGKLVHELSRLLYHVPRVTAEGTAEASPPVKMFISHAKADGADVAAAIRNHIHSDTSLKSFFDANDIAVGHRFANELLAALEESAIICLQTDNYATREWCLWEVINAKRLDRPVVVVNAINEREPRSFPYLGNVPTVRWQFDGANNSDKIQQVLDLTLFEVLGTRFRELFQRELIRTFDLPECTEAVGHPPELFTILKMAGDGSQRGQSPDNPRYVVYPEPPLGDEEIRLLEDLSPGIRFITPTMLPLVQHQIRLSAHESSQ